MADTEEEQIEAIKRWWDENGKSLIIGVVLALGAVIGYRAWENRVQEQGETAATVYDDMVEAIVLESPFAQRSQEQRETGEFLASRLKDEFSDSAYAHYAAMFLSRLAVEDGDLEKAEAELKWVLDNDVEELLEPIVRMRLARVLNARGKHEEALQTLVRAEPGEHRPSYEEIRGDIYLDMGDPVQAREAYQRALQALENPRSRPMLQMKLDDLEVPAVVVPAEPAAEAPEGDTTVDASGASESSAAGETNQPEEEE